MRAPLPFLFAALAPLDVADRYVLSLAYGLVILCFMAGTLWGFAAHRSDAFGYGASVIPAILAFGLLSDHVLSLGMGAVTRHWLLIALFVGLLPLDHWMQKQGLAPPWWAEPAPVDHFGGPGLPDFCGPAADPLTRHPPQTS